MADYTVTAANVLASTTASTADGTAGEAITQGDALYADATDSNKLKKADANLSSAAATVVGIALNSASTGQPVRYVTQDDDFTHGLTTVAASDVIILSGTAGKLAPVADLASGWFPKVVMIAKSATKAHLKILSGSVAKA